MQSILTQTLLPTSGKAPQSGAKTSPEQLETQLSTEADIQSGMGDETTVVIRQQVKGEAEHSFNSVFEALPNNDKPTADPDASTAVDADVEGDVAPSKPLPDAKSPATVPAGDPDTTHLARQPAPTETPKNPIAAKDDGKVEVPVIEAPVRKKMPVVGAELAFGSRRIARADIPPQTNEIPKDPASLTPTASGDTARPKGEVLIPQTVTPQASIDNKAIVSSTLTQKAVPESKEAVPVQTRPEVPQTAVKSSGPQAAQKAKIDESAQTAPRIQLTKVTGQTPPPPKAETGVVFATTPETVAAKILPASQAGFVPPLIKPALTNSTEPRFARRETAAPEAQLEIKAAKPIYPTIEPTQIAPPTAQNPALNNLQKQSVEASQATIPAVEGDPILGPRADISSSPVPSAQQHVQATAPLAHHVARQVAEAMQQMPNRPVEITLSPEELGRVRMAMSTTESGIVVSVLTERPETADLMRRHISNLETAFQEIGYSDISFSFDGGAQAEGDGDRDGAEHGQSGPFSATDDPPVEVASINLNTGTSAGLDIRL